MIKYGLMDSLPLPPKLSSKHCIRTRDETKMALETLQDYIQVGAVKDIKPRPGQTFNTLVFNQETGKFKTNYRLQREKSSPGAKTFQVGRLAGKFSFLRKGMWGAKVDLKHAYFHLRNSEKLMPYMRVNLGEDIYQFTAAVFCLNVPPEIFMSVMKVLQNIWGKKEC